MTTSSNARAELTITGRVQGVFLRSEIKAKSQALHLVGFSENRADGTVRVVAEGSRDALENLLAWCQTGGPTFANVEHVEIQWKEPSGGFHAFEVE